MIKLDSIEGLKQITAKAFNVAQINSIEYLYPQERQDSKAPTFA